MASMSSLYDNFNDNSTGAIWTPGNDVGVSVTERNSRLEIDLGTAGSLYGWYSSTTTYDLTGSYAFVKIAQLPSAASGTQMFMQVSLDTNNRLIWIWNGQGSTFQIAAQKKISGTSTTITSTSSATLSSFAWLRIRESSGTIYFDYAPSTASNPPAPSEWVNYTSLANPFAVTAVTLGLDAGTWQAVANPGTCIFDGFNTAASSIPNVSATFSAVYGTRKLVPTYTGNALQVRRSSDNTTSEIGFLSNGDLDVYSLANFVGVSNVKTYSEQFDNANWGKVSSAVVANQALAPDGNFTAEKVYGTGGTVSHYLSSSLTLTGNGSASVYAKAAEWNVITLSNSPNNWVHFQLSGSGSVSTIGTGWSGGSISYIGDGWYRCFAYTTTQTTAWSNIYVFISNVWPISGNSVPNSTASSGTNGLYVWGYQANASTTLLDYCQTTTATTSTGTGYVSKWYDQSGNGRDLVQATSSNQPIIITGGLVQRISSNPAISFTSASSQYLSVTGFTASQPWSRSSVWEMTDVSNGTGRVFLDNSNSSLDGSLTTSSTSKIAMSRGGTSSLTLTTGLVEGYKSHIMEISDGWSSNGDVNNGTVAMGYTGTNGCDGLIVGCSKNNTSYATGLCGEIAIIPSVVTNSDKSTISSSQASYWTTDTGVTVTRRRPMITT